MRVNDVPSIVIGVMPEGFKFPMHADVWQPLVVVREIEQQKRNARQFEVFGRLAPGVRAAAGESRMLAIGQRLTRDYPDTNKDVQPNVQTFNQRLTAGPRCAVFLSLMGAVGFVLLIACANVANLLLARSAQRSREIAVRVSIGATRWRLVRQLLIESVLLGAHCRCPRAGAVVCRHPDVRCGDAGCRKPYWIQFTMDGRVIAFLAAICLGTGIIFGLAPALHVSKTDVNEVLKEGGRSGSAGTRVRRWSGALIIGELALTLTLLAGAGFMVRNFLTHYRMDLGIDSSKLLTMQLGLPDRKYPSIEQRLAFYEQLQQRLQGNPRDSCRLGCQQRAASGRIRAAAQPRGADAGRRRTAAHGDHDHGRPALLRNARTLDPARARLHRVRRHAGSGVGGHQRRFAQMHFKQEDPIGKRITLSIDLGGGPAPAGGIPLSLTPPSSASQRRAAAGFAAAETDPVAYLPYRTDPRAFMTLLARPGRSQCDHVGDARRDPRHRSGLPLYGIRTLNESLAQQRWPFRIFGTMFAIFAFIALVLSAVGLYAVTSYQ